MTRTQPAGDVDYEAGGPVYAGVRRPDPRIATRLYAALGDARSVLNVGAGAGSYEPTDRDVTAVEPSAVMRAQRPAHLSRAIDATAEDLPFADDTFDASMTTFSVHQWPDADRGLCEMRRVTRGPVLIMSADGDAYRRFWLREYVPELIEAEAARYPTQDHMASVLGGTATSSSIMIPLDCTDGFVEAFYGRPESLLDPAVRAAQSAWNFVEPVAIERGLGRLRDDLDNGEWDVRYGALRTQPEFDGALRLLVAG